MIRASDSLIFLSILIVLSWFEKTVCAWGGKGSPKRIKNECGRRQIVAQILQGGSTLIIAPSVCSAGEIGAKITKAVTESDLGISVRRSVVRGAQIFDGFDAKLESFSDQFRLGTARSERPGRPAGKVIPDPKPLDSAMAKRVLEIADTYFSKLANVGEADLAAQVANVVQTVMPSFARSGVAQEDMQIEVPTNGVQFNFAAYTHFKAYSDLILARQIDFSKFKQQFEQQVGQNVVAILLPDARDAFKQRSSNCAQFTACLERINQLCDALVDNGFVAAIDQAPIDAEALKEWCDGADDLAWSIALDGDITLDSQMLLQEQGFRLYPNFARYAVQSVLQSAGAPEVSVMDYYMDTDYNSNPEKFEVKEVLLNIELTSG